VRSSGRKIPRVCCKLEKGVQPSRTATTGLAPVGRLFRNQNRDDPETRHHGACPRGAMFGCMRFTPAPRLRASHPWRSLAKHRSTGASPVVTQRCAKGTVCWFRNVVPPGQARWRPRALILQQTLNQMVDIPRLADILNHMVLDRSPTLDRVFHALAHPARRAILRQLSDREQNLSQLSAPLKMSFPAASKHVRVLERARLVRRRVVGRAHLCRLEAKPLADASDWLEDYRRIWEGTFQRLDALLDELKTQEKVARTVKGEHS
jgi:DNA-binding transcriptional ArsR family regulator